MTEIETAGGITPEEELAAVKAELERWKAEMGDAADREEALEAADLLARLMRRDLTAMPRTVEAALVSYELTRKEEGTP